MRNLVFAYHDIGCAAIEALRDLGEEICAVVTHEDDRKENVWFGSVRDLARRLELPVFTPPNPNAPEWVARFADLRPDAIFSFYYRQMISPAILGIPPKGSYNLHGSLLPRYRGRAPVNWVLVRGEKETGLTLHHMVEKPDAGDIVAQERVEITDADTAWTLYRKLVPLARGILTASVPQIARGTAPRLPQDPSQASYFGGRKAEDGKIDWTRTAKEIYNLVRAVTHPYPGAFTTRSGKPVFVWEAKPGDGKTGGSLPGAVIALEPLTVACGDGTLEIRKLQSAGGEEMEAGPWTRANSLNLGESFGGP